MKHKHEFSGFGEKSFKDIKCKVITLQWNNTKPHTLEVCECGLNYYDYMTPKVEAISKCLREAATDPEVIERGNELQRTLGRISWEELNRPFDI
jgi:hypothetical protein